MAVRLGSAHGDEHGRAYGGHAGDQTGNEVSIENWYRHPKGWVLIRPKAPVHRQIIADTMLKACKNKHIGYDQYQRNTLFAEAQKVGFDVEKVEKDVETDCSALVRVCCAAAGITLPDYNTATQVSTFSKNPAFEIIKEDKYCASPDYLRRGDILVTKTKGHTVVVLDDGDKAAGDALVLGCRVIRKGDVGRDVEQLQQRLNDLGFDCGVVDGDFGKNTESGVRAFQQACHLNADGIFNPDAFIKLLDAERKKVEAIGHIRIFNCSSCYAREIPNTSGRIMKVLRVGEIYEEAGRPKKWESASWNYIRLGDGSEAWVSDKYSERI